MLICLKTDLLETSRFRGTGTSEVSFITAIPAGLGLASRRSALVIQPAWSCITFAWTWRTRGMSPCGTPGPRMVRRATRQVCISLSPHMHAHMHGAPPPPHATCVYLIASQGQSLETQHVGRTRIADRAVCLTGGGRPPTQSIDGRRAMRPQPAPHSERDSTRWAQSRSARSSESTSRPRISAGGSGDAKSLSSLSSVL